MHSMEAIRVALEALGANKLRTLLTVLANMVAVMSVMAVVTIINGLNSYFEATVAGRGSGIFQVQQINALEAFSDYDNFLKSLHNPRITLSEAVFLRKHVTMAECIDERLITSAEVRNGAMSVKSASIQGRSENYPMLAYSELADGRHFTEQEVIHCRNVAVIGFELAHRLYYAMDPIGREFRIVGLPFRVIGVLTHTPQGPNGKPNFNVIIPITSFQKVFGGGQSLIISVKPASLEQAADSIEQTRLAMRSVRRLRPRQDDNFGIITQENLLKLWRSLTSRVFAVLVATVSISIIVGGIVIMNIMLVSVTERTQEIGIRKAVGATRDDILSQFLIEAITLSSLGGTLGIASGFVAAAGIASHFSLPYMIEPWSICAGMGISFTVGVFFGVYPALKAARLDPIEALRYE